MRVATQDDKDDAPKGGISIHATHAGGDSNLRPCQDMPFSFQSTPPMRVATLRGQHGQRADDISIHATHAGGDATDAVTCCIRHISIHATHAGGDGQSDTT